MRSFEARDLFFLGVFWVPRERGEQGRDDRLAPNNVLLPHATIYYQEGPAQTDASTTFECISNVTEYPPPRNDLGKILTIANRQSHWRQ